MGNTYTTIRAAEIPPECPMHQKPTVIPPECPMHNQADVKMDKNWVSECPSNMARYVPCDYQISGYHYLFTPKSTLLNNYLFVYSFLALQTTTILTR